MRSVGAEGFCIKWKLCVCVCVGARARLSSPLPPSPQSGIVKVFGKEAFCKSGGVCIQTNPFSYVNLGRIIARTQKCGVKS